MQIHSVVCNNMQRHFNKNKSDAAVFLQHFEYLDITINFV